jgi:hypothetical protein
MPPVPDLLGFTLTELQPADAQTQAVGLAKSARGHVRQVVSQRLRLDGKVFSGPLGRLGGEREQRHWKSGRQLEIGDGGSGGGVFCPRLLEHPLGIHLFSGQIAPELLRLPQRLLNKPGNIWTRHVSSHASIVEQD